MKVTIKAGESVEWTNNAGFPHNIVFDEDNVPEGVNVEKLSREDYLNAPGETYKLKFEKAGEYGYYCEPHQGAGMKGKIIGISVTFGLNAIVFIWYFFFSGLT